VGTDAALCVPCWNKVRFLEQPWCESLGVPFVRDPGRGALTADAIADRRVFRRARAAVAYGGPASQLVRALKFEGQTELAPMMAKWMLRVDAELARDADMVVAVPLHRQRYYRRRYNQSAELARNFAGLTGVEHVTGALVRVLATRQQVGLNARQRRENVRGAFRGFSGRVGGRRVLLVDDVFTTGSTVSAAAGALLLAGAVHVDVLTFARVLPEGFAA